jgi:Flp pilus assembly protein TadB
MTNATTNRRIPRPILYALVGLLVSQVALTVTAVGWSSANTARSERNAEKALRDSEHNTEKALQEWCKVLRVFRESYAQSPPTTDTGIKIRDGLNLVYQQRHCDQVQEP